MMASNVMKTSSHPFDSLNDEESAQTHRNEIERQMKIEKPIHTNVNDYAYA